MDSIQKVNKVCQSVRKLQDEDFEAVIEMAKKQSEYVHPLKMGTAAKLHDTGDYNFRVIEALKNLKSVIESRPINN